MRSGVFSFNLSAAFVRAKALRPLTKILLVTTKLCTQGGLHGNKDNLEAWAYKRALEVVQGKRLVPFLPLVCNLWREERELLMGREAMGWK